MDSRAYLTELGYSNEDITAMLADEKQSKLITAAAKSYSEGRTLKQQAEAEKAETATFWETKTKELEGSVSKLTAAEKRAAQAEAAAASRSAYLKSLADFARTKHGFAAKQAEKAQAEAEAAYKTRYEADLAKEKAKWAEANGSNPDTRAPLPSKFDRLEKTPGFKSDSWKSLEGRNANRAARLKRFENLPIQ